MSIILKKINNQQHHFNNDLKLLKLLSKKPTHQEYNNNGKYHINAK